MKKIMVATDFSERSDRALRRATMLATEFEATIVLVHVVDDDQPQRIVDTEQSEAETLLQQTAATQREVDGVTCETRVILASSFAGIIQAAQNENPDLLVIGQHRRNLLKDVFIGTTAERTIRLVNCPVLMVNAPPARPYQHVMQTTNLSDASRDALRRFRSLGLSGAAWNTLLYVFFAPALRLAFRHSMQKDEQDHYLAEEKRAAHGDLADFLATADLGDVTPMVRFEATAAHNDILKAADEEDADLIVLSTHGRTGLAKLLIGSVTERVLRTAPMDVLAIPALRSAQT